MTDPLDGYDGSPDDPRIETMIIKAGTITELVLNAEFLLDACVIAYLKSMPETYSTACEIGLTAEQRFYLATGSMGCFEDVENGSQAIFNGLARIYHVRAKTGHLPPNGLQEELTAALGDVWRSEMRQTIDEAPDRFEKMKSILAGHFCFACGYMADVRAQNAS